MNKQNAGKVRALIDAINAGDGNRALAFFHPEIVQHDPYTVAGPEALRRHILDLSAKRPQIEVVRLLEDDPFVVAQLRSKTLSQDQFVVHRYIGGQIAEQWAFFTEAAPPNRSGHTQVDGPKEPRRLENTEENKSFVRKYYQTFHLAGDRSRNSEFFTGDVMIRHEPGVEDGLANFLNDVEELMKQRTIEDIRLLVGEGDLVFIAADGTHQGKPCVYIDLYRVENRKIVEHWGFPQMTPPGAERLNSIPMF